MPFDLAYDLADDALAVAPVGAADLIDAAGDPDPALAAGDPERLLAFLFVAPRECAAVDALLAG